MRSQPQRYPSIPPNPAVLEGIRFRYMWWTLEYWMTDQTQTQWVQHYMGLVTGDGIAS